MSSCATESYKLSHDLCTPAGQVTLQLGICCHGVPRAGCSARRVEAAAECCGRHQWPAHQGQSKSMSQFPQIPVSGCDTVHRSLSKSIDEAGPRPRKEVKPQAWVRITKVWVWKQTQLLHSWMQKMQGPAVKPQLKIRSQGKASCHKCRPASRDTDTHFSCS